MAGFTAAKKINQQAASLPPIFKNILVADLGESIYEGTLVAKRTDGKFYAADPREGARPLGIAVNTALTTGTTALKVQIGPSLRVLARTASTVAIASDDYHAIRVVSSDDDNTLNQKDDGVLVYAVDGTQVTAHPKIPNSIPIGRLFVDVIDGGAGVDTGYIHFFDQVNIPPNWHGTDLFEAYPSELGGRSDFTIPARRIVLRKTFDKRIIATVAQSAGSTQQFEDSDFGAAGSAGTPVLDVTGGTSVLTGGSDNDIVQVVPHATAEVSPFKKITWSQGLRLRCMWEFSLAAATSINIVIGMRITVDGSTAAGDRTTDADFSFLTMSTDLSETTFKVSHVSDGGTVVTTDTGVTATAATNYMFTVDFDEDGVARYYLKAQGDRSATLIYTATAVTSAAVTLKPTAVLQTLTGAAKTFTLVRVLCAQDIA